MNNDKISAFIDKYKYRFIIEKTNLFYKIIKPGMTIIDCGACLGYYSILAYSIMKGIGTVVAIEPELNNFYTIGENAKELDCPGIIGINKALSNIKKIGVLNVGPRVGWHSLNICHWEGREQEVEIDTLDNVLSDLNISNVNILKIDIEGQELKLLEEARTTIANSEDIYIFLETHYDHITRKEVFEYAHDNNFITFDVFTGNIVKEYKECSTELLCTRGIL